MVRSLTVFVVAVLSCGFADKATVGPPRPEQKLGAAGQLPDGTLIGKIMVAAHVRDINGRGNRSSGRNLDARVLSGKATDQENTRLLELYRQLAKATPPKGSIGEWRADTTPLVQAMEGVIAGKPNALEQLRKPLNCKACHEKYRTRFPFGVSGLTDVNYYDRLASDRVWKSSGRPLPPRRMVEQAGRIAKAGGSPQHEQLPKGWSMVVDYPKRTTDEALLSLRGARDVSEIRILNGGVSDKGLAHLRELPDLRVLVINSADVTDAGMKVIGTLKRLTTLDIMSVRVTGKGLAELSRLTELSGLHLFAVKLGDQDLSPLKGIRGLKRLSFPPTLSARGIDNLRRSLPDTQIAHEGKD